MNREEWRTKATAQTQENKRLLGSKLGELTDMYLISLLTQKELQEELDESHAKIAELYHENERLRLELKGCEFWHKRGQDQLKQAIEALEWYANRGNYQFWTGQHAREALSLIREGAKKIVKRKNYPDCPACGGWTEILGKCHLCDSRFHEGTGKGESQE